MIILLFGISNVGKTTIGKLLGEKLGYPFIDIDEEIKRTYGYIDSFREAYPDDNERYEKKVNILKGVVQQYKDNLVIAVSAMFFAKYINQLLEINHVYAIDLLDSPEHIFDRLVFADEFDRVYTDDEYKNKHKAYYLRDIKADTIAFEFAAKKIKNKFNMNGMDPEAVTEKLYQMICDEK